jgi:hypothetical protein
MRHEGRVTCEHLAYTDHQCYMLITNTVLIQCSPVVYC